MEITVRSKLKRTKEGRPFTSFFTSLQKQDGSTIACEVKFKDVSAPESFPCNIVIEKGNANLSTRNYTANDGSTKHAHTLWITAYQPGSAFVDHSLDEFI